MLRFAALGKAERSSNDEPIHSSGFGGGFSMRLDYTASSICNQPRFSISGRSGE